VGWKVELSALIHERWRAGQTFNLGQVYEFESKLGSMHPRNSHIRDKIRQTLQYLRDDGELSFLGATGHYLLLK
jgi:type II restriction enzyme